MALYENDSESRSRGDARLTSLLNVWDDLAHETLEPLYLRVPSPPCVCVCFAGSTQWTARFKLGGHGSGLRVTRVYLRLACHARWIHYFRYRSWRCKSSLHYDRMIPWYHEQPLEDLTFGLFGCMFFMIPRTLLTTFLVYIIGPVVIALANVRSTPPLGNKLRARESKLYKY